MCIKRTTLPESALLTKMLVSLTTFYQCVHTDEICFVLTENEKLYYLMPKNKFRLGLYYSIQNKGADSRDPVLPIGYVCRMSTSSSFYIFRSMHCCKTLITAKKLNLLRSQKEEYQTSLVYLANINSIPIWYQKHFCNLF